LHSVRVATISFRIFWSGKFQHKEASVVLLRGCCFSCERSTKEEGGVSRPYQKCMDTPPISRCVTDDRESRESCNPHGKNFDFSS
jgi:hypothetical protein